MSGAFDPFQQVPPELEVIFDRACAAVDELEFVHEPTVTSSAASSAPGQQPDPVILGDSILGLAFTVGTDDAFRTFKVPGTYIPGTASFHIHWSKSTNLDDSAKTVRWRVTMKVFNGFSDEVTSAGTVFDVDDTYDDSGTTTRIVYHSPDVSLDGLIQPGYYLGLKVEAVTPPGSALSEPVLVSLDLEYQKRVHVLT